MRWVTADRQTKKLLIHEKRDETTWQQPVATAAGFEESITRRAVHELLFQPSPCGTFPFFPALIAARSAVTNMAGSSGPLSAETSRTLVWMDAAGTFYPPAVAGLGLTAEQICVLRPRAADLVWAAAECLRCQSVGAVVALVTQRLTRVEVRRLQLAAERGSGVGVLLRPNLASASSETYAAATRWLVTPTPGERTIQRWRLQFVHGHGGHIGQSFILENHRATGQANFVRPPSSLVRHAIRQAAS